MSVYIKNMNMPTAGHILVVFPSGRTLEVSADKTQNIFREAQAIFVPPHGDLIDRKALLADTTDMIHSMMVFGGARVYTSDAIKNAPAVIPAEEAE